MDLAKLVKELKHYGVHHSLIAKRAGCNRALIKRIEDGEANDPAFSVVVTIIELHDFMVKGESLVSKTI